MPSDTGSTPPASFFGGYRFALGCLGGVNGSNPWKLIIVGAAISVYGDDIFGHASSEGGFVFTFTYFCSHVPMAAVAFLVEPWLFEELSSELCEGASFESAEQAERVKAAAIRM